MTGPISIFEGKKGKLPQEFSCNANKKLLQAGNNGRCSVVAAIATVLSELGNSKEPSLLPNGFHRTFVNTMLWVDMWLLQSVALGRLMLLSAGFTDLNKI